MERIAHNRETFGAWWEDIFPTMFVAFADEGIDCDGNKYEQSELPRRDHDDVGVQRNSGPLIIAGAGTTTPPWPCGSRNSPCGAPLIEIRPLDPSVQCGHRDPTRRIDAVHIVIRK